MRRFDREPELLLDFARDALLGTFGELELSARQFPFAAPVVQENDRPIANHDPFHRNGKSVSVVVAWSSQRLCRQCEILISPPPETPVICRRRARRAG